MKKFISFLITLVMVVSLFAVMPVVSASESTPKITYKTINKSYYADDGHKIFEVKLKRPFIKGNKKAYKKINNKFKKLQASYIKNLSEYVKNAKNDYKYNKEYFYCEYIKSSIKPVYIKGNVISFKDSYDFFGGGPHNFPHIQGYTFNLKTGKKVNISQVTKYGSKIKSKIVSKFQKKADSNPNLARDMDVFGMEKVRNTKLKDFNYYLKGNYVYVIYNIYEIASYASGMQKIRIKIK